MNEEHFNLAVMIIDRKNKALNIKTILANSDRAISALDLVGVFPEIVSMINARIAELEKEFKQL